MQAVGIVVEYNPFHNGHAHHLTAAKEITGADAAVAVMSGNFLQRGEPALVSKWYRAKMALHGGVDVVVELPYAFATQKAETFSNGAVAILDALGCSSLCFGSESGDISAFYKTYQWMEEHKEIFEEKTRVYVKTGVSYPKAVSLAFAQLHQSGELIDLSKPNNILGFHYVKAIMNQKSAMKPVTIKRKNAGYHDEFFASERIASATSIRNALFAANSNDSIDPFVPSATSQLLKDYFQRYGMFHQWENYYPYLQFRLLQALPEELREIYEMEEGIENRLIKAAKAAASFKEFMEKVKTKRYTWTRLQRICLHVLTNMKKEQMNILMERPKYIRLLGMTEKGKIFLNRYKSHFSLPLISKLSSYKQDDVLPDIKAAAIYASVLPKSHKQKSMSEEYTQPPIFLK